MTRRQQNHLTLDNGIVALSFDSRTGSLCNVEHVSSGTEFLREASGHRLLRVMAPAKDWLSRYADSHQAQACECRLEGETLTLAYPDLAFAGTRPGVAATVTVRLPAGSPEAFFSLELVNRSSDLIDEVRFPWVGGWAGIGGPGKDQMMQGFNLWDPYKIVPSASTWTIAHAHQRIAASHGVDAIPVFDVSNGTTGMWTICYHRQKLYSLMHFESLSQKAGQTNLSWSFVFAPFLRRGARWLSPPVGIGVHRGDWHAAGDHYRGWLKTWWTPKAVSTSLRKSLGFQNVMFRNLGDGAPFHRFSEIPKIAAAGKKCGIDHLCVWEAVAGRYSHHLRKDVWEDDPKRLDELRRALREARRQGCNVSVLVNALLVLPGTEPYRRYGQRLVARNALQQPYHYAGLSISCYHAKGYPGPERFEPYGEYCCQGSREWQTRALAAVAQTLRLGFTSVFLDQGSTSFPCFAENHDHASPGAVPEIAGEWIRKAAAMVRAANKDGYLIGEHPDLAVASSIDLWWNWCMSMGVARMEVFRYVLPELLHAWECDLRLDLINRGFAMGCPLAFTTDALQKTLADYPALARHVARLARLRKATADATVMGEFKDRIGLTVEPQIPAYVHQTATAFGIIAAEVAGQTQKVGLTFDPTAHGRTIREAKVRDLDGPCSNHGRIGARGRYQWRGKMGPHGVMVVDLETVAAERGRP